MLRNNYKFGYKLNTFLTFTRSKKNSALTFHLPFIYLSKYQINLYCCAFLFLMTDSYVTTQHALPQNISQYETPALPQPAFDQQTLTQGTNPETCILNLIDFTKTIISVVHEVHSRDCVLYAPKKHKNWVIHHLFIHAGHSVIMYST